MVFDLKLKNPEEFRLFENQNKMSNKVSGRNLLGIKINNARRLSDVNLDNNNSPNSPVGSCTTDFDTDVEYKLDCNRNSIIGTEDIHPTDICEVTSTEIQEKTAKKKSAITSLRNLVKATVIVTNPLSNANNNNKCSNTKQINDDCVDINKGTNDKFVRRKRLSIIPRKKRNRRSRAIQNEGQSLWKPTEPGCWQSAGGRKVDLQEIALHELCEAEMVVLNQIAIALLKEKLNIPINTPKEYHPAVRRRWKQLIMLGKKQKGEQCDKASRPRNPLFNVELAQSMENEKETAKSHKEQMAKLDDLVEDDNEACEKGTLEQLNNDINFYNNKRSRRNSDPLLKFSSSLNSDEDDMETDFILNNLRTFDTLKEEDEDDLPANKRKSRLIEALQLSSISASSVCILDKDREFKTEPLKLPKVLVQSADFICTYALNTVGIFRTGGSKKRVRQMKEDYDNGLDCVITEESNPHDVAAIFKEFLRCLPDPLLTRELYPAFLATAKLQYEDLIFEVLKYLIWLLPMENRDTLELALSCLKTVSEHSQDSFDHEGTALFGNKMDAQNLATLMAPNILHRCKTYKTQNSYQVDAGMNPEDNKASIDVVYNMIVNNDLLFKITADEHDQVLQILLESEPETVDYILKQKSSRTSYQEEIDNIEEEIEIKPTANGRRPSSAGPRTRYSFEDVNFLKSNSFNQGPYKPFVRRRKESITDSRPQSTRSDPPDRSSYRKSGFGTSPLSRRKSTKIFADSEKTLSTRDSSSPRDSGVVCSSTPPFQRNSLRKSCTDSLISPTSSPSSNIQRIILRKNSRDRDSRDSAYDSGMTGMFSNRTSAANSVHIPTLDVHEEITNINLSAPSIKITSSDGSPKIQRNNLEKVRRRKISLPAYATTESRARFNPASFAEKSSSLDYSDQRNKERSKSTINWDDESSWPDWVINPRQSQFPTQETTL